MNTIKTYHSASSADYITPCEENDFDISLIEQLASSSLTSLKESYAGLGEKVYTLAERVIDLKKSEYEKPSEVKKPSLFKFIKTTNYEQLTYIQNLINKKNYYVTWPLLKIIIQEITNNINYLKEDYTDQRKIHKTKYEYEKKEHKIILDVLDTQKLDNFFIDVFSYNLVETLYYDLQSKEGEINNLIHTEDETKNYRDGWRSYLKKTLEDISKVENFFKNYSFYKFSESIEAAFNNIKVELDLILHLLEEKNNLNFICTSPILEFSQGDIKKLNISSFSHQFEKILTLSDDFNQGSLGVSIQKANFALSKFNNDSSSSLLCDACAEIQKEVSESFTVDYKKLIFELQAENNISNQSLETARKLFLTQELLNVTHQVFFFLETFFNTSFLRNITKINLQLPYMRWNEEKPEYIDCPESFLHLADLLKDIRLIDFDKNKEINSPIDHPIDLFFGNSSEIVKTYFQTHATPYQPISISELSEKSNQVGFSTLPGDYSKFLSYSSIDIHFNESFEIDEFKSSLSHIYDEFNYIISELESDEKTLKLQNSIRQLFTKSFERHIMECLFMYDYYKIFNKKTIPLSEILPKEILKMSFFTFDDLYESMHIESMDWTSKKPVKIAAKNSNKKKNESASSDLSLLEKKFPIDQLNEQEKEFIEDFEASKLYSELIQKMNKYYEYLKKEVFNSPEYEALLNKYESNRISKSGHGQIFGATISTHKKEIDKKTKSSIISQLEKTILNTHKDLHEFKKR